MQALDQLGSELENSGFQKVAFIEVECKKHGTHRIGIRPDQRTGRHFECPTCHEKRPCSPILARGFCRRPLPFVEKWWSYSRKG